MTFQSDADSITAESLAEAGSLKWTAYPGTVAAWIAESDFGIAEPIAQALHTAVARGLTGYLPAHLGEELRDATAAWMARRYDWAVDPDRVRLVPDVLSALVTYVDTELAAGARIVVPTPAYMPFVTPPGNLGREVVEVPLAREARRWVYDLGAIEEALRPGDLLILCNPHNPVGRVLDRSELLGVADAVERRGARVFADEIHAPLTMPGFSHLPYASLDERTARHTLTATSASKAWNLPGLKCAQLIHPGPATARAWDGTVLARHLGPSTLGVVANVAAYSRGEEWLTALVAYVARNAAVASRALDRATPAVTAADLEGTYLMWLDLRGHELEGGPAAFFRERAGVALTDGALCGRAGAGFARLNLATPTPVLEQALDRMVEALGR